MKILYIGVHSHIGWGAEFWLAKAFHDLKINYELLDYRKELKESSLTKIINLIKTKSENCDLIFLQRGDHLSPMIFNNITIPIVFWSTEPIELKNDVDTLLSKNIFSWVYVHSYSCLERIKNEFQHLLPITSVMHNAAPKEKLCFSETKNIFAIFNRNLSFRRKYWLWPARKKITKISGKYGNAYFQDLRASTIAINIHYSKHNLDDFESGIFEAMISGCVIISETLHYKTLKDLGMEKAIIQINSPFSLNRKLEFLKMNPEIIHHYKKETKDVIQNNTWHDRAKFMKEKFKEICNK